MASQLSPTMRKQLDYVKLIMAGYDLKLNDANTHEFHVIFHGPKDTLYENGVWRVHVMLPDDYPFSSPSIGFVNKILHPNIDEDSGSVCLDVINHTWTPLYSLVNIFDVFLPQLLTYPNPADPLNVDLAALSVIDRTKYNDKIREYVLRYATGVSLLPTKSNSITQNRLINGSDPAIIEPSPNKKQRPSSSSSSSTNEKVLQPTMSTVYTTRVGAPSTNEKHSREQLCQSEVRGGLVTSESTSGSAASSRAIAQDEYIDEGFDLIYYDGEGNLKTKYLSNDLLEEDDDHLDDYSVDVSDAEVS